MTPYEWMMALLDAAGSQPLRRSPRQCPAHGDAAPSLSLSDRDGVLYMHCFAGCRWQMVLAVMNCPATVFFHAPPVPPAVWAASYCPGITFPPLEYTGGHPSSAGFKLDAVHDYGSHLLERWRHPSSGEKDLRWHTRINGDPIPGLFGVPVTQLPLYREHEIRAAMALEEPVLLVESESSVDALTGWYATTWPGGAPVDHPGLDVVAGYPKLVMIPDMDAAGLEAASRVRRRGVTQRFVFANPGEDAKDLYARVGREEFTCRIEAALT